MESKPSRWRGEFGDSSSAATDVRSQGEGTRRWIFTWGGGRIFATEDEAKEILRLMKDKGTIPNYELSAEILFDWWISGKPWNEFKEDLLHPKLFE